MINEVPLMEALFQVGDVVRVHCSDPRCKCMDEYCPAIVIGLSGSLVGNQYHYIVKLPFEDSVNEWTEKHMELLERKNEL